MTGAWNNDDDDGEDDFDALSLLVTPVGSLELARFQGEIFRRVRDGRKYHLGILRQEVPLYRFQADRLLLLSFQEVFSN